jgi:hypothetical protein
MALQGGRHDRYEASQLPAVCRYCRRGVPLAATCRRREQPGPGVGRAPLVEALGLPVGVAAVRPQPDTVDDRRFLVRSATGAGS